MNNLQIVFLGLLAAHQRPGSFNVEQAMEKLSNPPSSNQRSTMQPISELRSPTAALSKCQRRCIGFVFALFMVLCCSTGHSYGAENLECPEIGSRWVPEFLGDASGGGLFATDNRIDLANEINESINRLQIVSPNISWADVQNVLIAAYCRVVTRTPGLAAAEKWDRMRQFDNVLERQIAANMMPAGTLIIANVPLAPDVYRELKRQAVSSNQTTAQLMAAILTRAAGR